MNLLDIINDTAGSIIDEYEHDNIEDMQAIQRCIVVLRSLALSNNSGLLVSIIFLFEEAYKRKTGIHFYF